jgi:small subunit ribosomal protein S21
MIEVKVKKGNINKALKEFKNKTIKSKIMSEVRDRREFTKKSVTKRKQKQRAIYREHKKRESEN